MLKANTRGGIGFLAGIVLGILAASQPIQAGSRTAIPQEFVGRLFVSSEGIDLDKDNWPQELRRLDRGTVQRDRDGKWELFFVAFFAKPLPAGSVGIVVLDSKQETVVLGEIGVARGQTTLISSILVEKTSLPGAPHVLQLFLMEGKRPKVLVQRRFVLE